MSASISTGISGVKSSVVVVVTSSVINAGLAATRESRLPCRDRMMTVAPCLFAFDSDRKEGRSNFLEPMRPVADSPQMSDFQKLPLNSVRDNCKENLTCTFGRDTTRE